MNPAVKRVNQKKEARYIDHLLKTVLEDPLIRKRFVELLQLPSFKRRMILNNWIETYWLKNTGPEIIQALACLYDDKVAEETHRLLTESNQTSYYNRNIKNGDYR